MTQATIQAGQIITESVQRRGPCNKDKALLIEAKEKGVVLDAEDEAFLAYVECTGHYDDSLAITTSIAFKLKEELTAIRIKNDSLRDKNVSIKACFHELYKSKIGSNSSVRSGATIPVKPKAVASGLYAMTPKYVPPQKRINKETNSSLPRKETVTVKNLSNVPVNLPTGIKSVPYASKSKSKSDKKIHKNFLTRCKNVKRVAKPPRNLNKKSYVYSSLNDKRTSFISKSVSVCKTCNECLVYGNHNECVVKSVNEKTQGDMFPLTRITRPEVVSLEISGSVRTSEPTNNVTVTPRFSKKTLTNYKHKDRNTKDTSTGSPSNIETIAAKYPMIVYPLPV
uniref:Uncharacterized protein n=1 Tax=Tanacetum cinerariifolium TaxID=118510 RepID=A0A6L2KRF8_TANCI|nr:hypothetical protein [Tanacetum cinerariifolium]